MSRVLMVGSGPSIRLIDEVDPSTWVVVAMNKAWAYRPRRVDYLVHMASLPGSRRPAPADVPADRVASYDQYIAAVHHYGRALAVDDDIALGFLTGHLIHFIASYWAMWRLRPAVVGYLGCDLEYRGEGPTHFYGRGQAIPWRDRGREPLDVYFERQACLAERQGVELVNLSCESGSRLPYRRVDHRHF
jgi:hypothetical protein